MRAALGPWVYGVFLISGMSALVDQMAWQRLLVLFAGGDVVAVTIIVTAFMAGLGIGSLIGGRLADRLSTRANVVVFIQAEIGIGLFGLCSAWLFHDVLYERLVMLVESRVMSALVLFGCLLPPTLLMGLSLPVLARVVTRQAPDAAGRIGMLYAANTLGAALGAFLATWVLLPTSGVEGALRWAALGNGLCAVLMIMGVWRMKDVENENDPVASKQSPHRLVVCLGVFFVTGFTALAAEMVWLRVLGAMAKSSAHTMGTLLAVYLGGLGCGAMAGSFVARCFEDAWRLFLRLQGLAVLYAACGVALALHLLVSSSLSTYLASYEPVDADTALRLLMGWWRGDLKPEDAAHVWTYPLLHAVVPLAVMFPATFLMGAGFPLMQKAAQTDASHVGWRTGALQGANILGSMAGAAGVTAVLLPGWGSAGVFMLLAVVGTLLLAAGMRRVWRVAALVMGVAVFWMLPDQKGLWAAVHGTMRDRLWLAEDATGLSVLKQDEVEPGKISVFINCIGQSWIPYGGVHTLLGALPVLLHEKPERVALIGLGSGDTLHAMLARKETREVWCAEIVAGQMRTLEAVQDEPGAEAVKTVLADARVHQVAGDGRMMILRDGEKFDVIEADALRPTSAHSGTLYSEEYFALMKARLRPGGMAVTWLPTPRVAATMRKVFPHVLVFGGVIGIGTVEPLRVDWLQIQARMDEVVVWSHFRSAGMDAHALLKPLLGPGAVILRLEDELEQETNTDLFPRDEWLLPSLGKKDAP
ncbi:MAG: fused MFS/spermidine synthase [Verrucomicrobiaceae bacterium]|nr:fused MFS/spermidine synthase [Verrucomicrobiaceae bacterium]